MKKILNLISEWENTKETSNYDQINYNPTDQKRKRKRDSKRKREKVTEHDN